MDRREEEGGGWVGGKERRSAVGCRGRGGGERGRWAYVCVSLEICGSACARPVPSHHTVLPWKGTAVHANARVRAAGGRQAPPGPVHTGTDAHGQNGRPPACMCVGLLAPTPPPPLARGSRCLAPQHAWLCRRRVGRAGGPGAGERARRGQKVPADVAAGDGCCPLPSARPAPRRAGSARRRSPTPPPRGSQGACQRVWRQDGRADHSRREGGQGFKRTLEK